MIAQNSPSSACTQQQAQHHPPSAQRFRQPEVVDVDQNQRQQQSHQHQTGPGAPEFRQTTTGLNRESAEPEQGTRQLDCRVAPADAGAAITASPPQEQPADHWQIVVPADGMAAARAMAAGNHHRFLPGQAPHHHVGEAANAGPEQGNDEQGHPFHRRLPRALRPRISSSSMNSSSGSRTGNSKTTLPPG